MRASGRSILALLLVLALARCGGPVPAVKARIAYARLPGFALVHIAREQGFFQKEGVQPEFKEFTTGRDALQAMLKGETEFATAYEAPLVAQACAGKDFPILTTLHIAPDGTAIVARKSAGISTQNDLRGKRIGVTVGTNADYFLQRFLLFAGLGSEDVTLVPLVPEENVVALRDRRVDAVATWTPLKEEAVDTLGSDALTFASDAYTEVSFLVARPDVPDDVSLRVLRALRDAQAFLTSSPASAMDELQRTLPDFSPSVARTVGKFTFAEGLNHLSLRALQDVTQWTQETHPSSCPVAPIFLDRMRPDLLRGVDPRAVMLD